jgi:glycosyltransferase involved in cell wall biosynthesis
VFLDITELLAAPLRTGIQRVVREIIRHWPGPEPLVPCRFDESTRRFSAVSEAVFEILTSEDAQAAVNERELLQPHIKGVRVLDRDELAAGLFNPEVFFEVERASAYCKICEEGAPNVSWLLYDFLPLLKPQYWPVGTPLIAMHYIRALRNVPRVCFISKATGIEYSTRIMRDPTRTGPHFPLGGDALQLEKQKFSADKRSFVFVGTIEARKNIVVVLEAFEQLWKEDIDVDLVMIGRIEATAVREQKALRRMEGRPHFTYHGHAGDAVVRDALRRARATLFVSAEEGFGIPPYESLSAGVPVITSSNLPSMELLPSGGTLTLAEATAQTLAAAVKRMLDDDEAARLWNEAARQVIPTWRDFARNVGAWVQQR